MGGDFNFEDKMEKEFKQFITDDSIVKDSNINMNLIHLSDLMVAKHNEYMDFFQVVNDNYKFIEDQYLLSPNEV